MTKLTVGNRKIAIDQAKSWVSRYTSPPKDPKRPYGYPAYDSYDTGGTGTLVEADLLAPALLNVRVSIAAFESLKTMVSVLNEQLSTISPEASLLSSAQTEIVGQLYAPLDSRPRPHGVKGTTLSKVLHRKRPDLVPLFDREVRKCFTDKHGRTAARVPYDRKRSWSDYMTLLAGEIRNDLLEAEDNWADVHEAVSGEVPITLLRCFDIVAWNCAQR